MVSRGQARAERALQTVLVDTAEVSRSESQVGREQDLSASRGHKEMAAAAGAAGLAFRYLPVMPGNVSSDMVAAFDGTPSQLPGPIFAYCRPGARSSSLWSLAAVSRW